MHTHVAGQDGVCQEEAGDVGNRLSQPWQGGPCATVAGPDRCAPLKATVGLVPREPKGTQQSGPRFISKPHLSFPVPAGSLGVGENVPQLQQVGAQNEN